MNYRTERYPVVTLSLIGINTLIYIVSLICFFITDGESDLWIYNHLWLTPSNWNWYACFTSIFVHGGLFHLLGNMIFLFLFGSCVEDIVGRLRFAIFYLVGGLIAEIAFIALSPEHFMTPHPLGGASGAISACMGMYLLLRADAEIEFKYFLWLFFFYFRAGEFEIPAWVAITFWFLKDLFWAVLGMFSKNSSGGVAFGAHVGGLLGGIALISFYRWIVRPRETKAAQSTLHNDLITQLTTKSKSPPSAAVTSETPAFFLYDGAEQTGPFTLSQVQEKLSAGVIGKDALYWSEGMTEWQSVVELSSHPLQ